ncbi:hypothetical protein AAFF_G00312430 [Aldrovandia affinis]|uniref:Uncharacterized protein n=1 Tax=Aldrovandia affinis TaxID=143900 RepID=A0AAD7WQL6_9TELE|nr:hypothetical protein AAFF_G00312430 [Aldrovandia affinis]
MQCRMASVGQVRGQDQGAVETGGRQTSTSSWGAAQRDVDLQRPVTADPSSVSFTSPHPPRLRAPLNLRALLCRPLFDHSAPRPPRSARLLRFCTTPAR